MDSSISIPGRLEFGIIDEVMSMNKKTIHEEVRELEETIDAVVLITLGAMTLLLLGFAVEYIVIVGL